MTLPKAGQIGVFLGSWYTPPILERVMNDGKPRVFEQALTRINAFERTLADGGALFIKLWFHVSKKEQRKRLKAEERATSTRLLVSKSNWQHHDRYDDFISVTERALLETSTGYAPWTVIESGDDRYRNMTAGRTILERIRSHLATRHASDAPKALPEIADPVTLLDRLDLSLKLEKPAYEERMAELQGELGELARKLKKRQRSAIFLFEGSDAAGKGGAIRRLVWALDARQYRVIPVSAPTDEERAHHYLWRFFRHLRRTYKEINDFEQELTSDGIVLIKFWLQISPDEQLRRFQDREREPWKQHKIGAEDYRNRAKTAQYEAAANDAIARCSTRDAPFTLIEANDKRHARVKVLETICDRLQREL